MVTAPWAFQCVRFVEHVDVLVGFIDDCGPHPHTSLAEHIDRHTNRKGTHNWRPANLTTGTVPRFQETCCSGRTRREETSQNGVNEFYKKGCQEKSSPSTGGENFFLEIQPTVVSLPWRSLAFLSILVTFSADRDAARRALESSKRDGASWQPWFYPRLVAYGYFWLSERA